MPRHPKKARLAANGTIYLVNTLGPLVLEPARRHPGPQEEPPASDWDQEEYQDWEPHLRTQPR